MKYRKKPVVIDAILWQGRIEDLHELRPFSCDATQGSGETHLTVHTLEGDMRADLGDYVIRGVKGELYPCKPDIFAATYEPAA